MTPQSSIDLTVLGWDAFFENAMAPYDGEGMIPARVMRQDKGIYTVQARSGSLAAGVAGRLRHDAASKTDLPVVGDWVALKPQQSDGQAVIQAVLERRSYFSRKEAGTRTDEQLLCANVDTAFIVSSLVGERGFVPRRIERYLTLVWNASVEPVVLLNKLDLCEDVESYVSQTEEVAPGVPVYAVSALTGEGMEETCAHLNPGKTAVLLGPSGVGKSSIINSLLGEETVKTGMVRADDGRGRHVTTWRELLVLPGRGVIIDTPGMRELQLWADEEALGDSFSDITALADSCKFRDCTHQREPGCAVRQAVEDGTLEAARLESYLRQQTELNYLDRRRDQQAKKIEQDKWKSIHRGLKTFNKIDPKRKWEKDS
ncbi:ribosome small subunit-dependent GTPase A [Acidobacteriota bacterium]